MTRRVSKKVQEHADALRNYLDKNQLNEASYLMDLTSIKTMGYRDALHTIAVRLEALRWMNMKTECTEMYYSFASPEEKARLDAEDCTYEEVRKTLWTYRKDLEKAQEEKRTLALKAKEARKRKQSIVKVEGVVKKEKLS